MQRRAFRPRKRFGQNFLYDPAIARKIVSHAGLDAGETVIELGAGRGILTKPLVETGVAVVALEIDRDLHAELELWRAELPGPAASRVELLNVDFTRVSLTGLLVSRGQEKCVLVGNLPYHLTSEVLFSFLVDEWEMVARAYLMVQREVGDRIVSPPGSRVYGITSVILQSLYRVRSLMKVSAGSFKPRPKVESLVLEFMPLEEPIVGGGELTVFSRFVKSVFQQRRKTIHSTMRSFYSLSETDFREIRGITEIDLDQRPEALSNEDFLQLSRAVAEVTSVG